MPEEDPNELAQELQQALGGGFDPFSLLAGERRFHSVFLAPLSRQLEEGRERFRRDGGGPLAGVVDQVRRQGDLTEDQARDRVRALLDQAAGVCVVVLADDQGPISIPHLFFGSLDDDYRARVAEGVDKPLRDAARAALLGLRTLADRGLVWPRLFVSADGEERAERYWAGLGGLLVRCLDEGLLRGPPERMADLAHWCARAIGAGERADVAADPERGLIAARCHAAAGEIAEAGERVAALLAAGAVEDEQLALFLQHLVDAAVAHRRPRAALELFERHAEALDQVLGGCYELALPRFKAAAAAMAPVDELIAHAEGLRRADRKAFRHDLQREPLWAVAVDDPGELLETHEAADLLERSVGFVSKRLEQGTIPGFRDEEDRLRIPRRGLDAWRAVMAHFQLLD